MTERHWIVRNHYVTVGYQPTSDGWTVAVDGVHVGHVTATGDDRRVEAGKLARTHLERTVPGANPVPLPYAEGTVYRP